MLNQGGAEHQLYCILRSLIDLGFEPTLLTFQADGYWKDPIENLGVELFIVDESNKIRKILKVLKYIHKGNYDYIHSQHFYTNFYALLASLIIDTKCVASLRSDAKSEIEELGVIGWSIIRFSHFLVANSIEAIHNIQNIHKRKRNVIYLPNVVDSNIYFPREKKRLNSNNIFKVITVGTTWGPKRIDRVIKIAKMVDMISKKINIQFEIFGDGEDFEKLINYAEETGVLNINVFFKGRSGDIPEIMRQSDILLLTSDYEGTPNVVLEAMASGLPVVATNVGDIPRIVIHEKTGFIHAPDDIEGMSESILRLARNNDECFWFGQVGREIILEKYSEKRLKESLIELYSK